MTSSLSLAQMIGSPQLRGVDTDYVLDILRQKQAITPMLLLRRSEIRSNYRALSAALPRARLHYAVKSNNHPVFAEELFALGGQLETCSAAEIDLALHAGNEASSLIYTHPIKSIPEFDHAVESGLRVFVVDNVEEVRKLARYTDTQLKILIRYRINTNTKAVVDLQYKFGCTPEEVVPLADEIRSAGHKVHGLCFHIGSQCLFSENYVRAIETASDLIKALKGFGHTICLLDIGGGFPVHYVEPIPTLDQLCRPINQTLDARIDPTIEIIAEPGRFISASPVTLLTSVIGKAHRDGKMWYYLDDGLYSTFSGILYDHCQYPVITEQLGEGILSVLAGPTCDSFDVIYDGLMIPEHQIGDIMMFPLTGAYCAVSGSNFNSLKRPDYIIIE